MSDYAPNDRWDLSDAPEATEDPTHFYCDVCDKWTEVHMTENEVVFCSRCGEEYRCGECGFEIDQKGNCLRPGGHEGEL